MKSSLALASVSLAALLGGCGGPPEPRGTVTPSRPALPPAWTQTSVAAPPTAPLPEATPGPESQIVFPSAPPPWLADLAVDVLAVVIGGETPCRETGTYPLLFVNAETGEQFEVTVAPARAMMWLDPTTFGLLSMDGQTIVSIDLTDGAVGTTSFEAEGIRLLRRTESFSPAEFACMTPLNIVWGEPSVEGAVVFISPRSSYSADLSLFAEVSERVDVRRVETGEAVWTSDPEPEYPEYDGIAEYEAAWSPVDPMHLAVVQCNDQGTDMCWPQRLIVVDVARGEELASYPGEFMDISWSSDGRRILYQHLEWEVVDRFSGPPCLLDLTTDENECLDSVVQAHFGGDLETISGWRSIPDIRWDQRMDGFYYTYQAGHYRESDTGTPGPLRNDQGTVEPPLARGGLCHFDLPSQEIDCLSAGVPELQGVWINAVELSPDERFAYVQTWWEGSDIHGVLQLRSGRFYRLGGLPSEPTTADIFDAARAVWRPLSPTATPAATVHTTRPTEQDVRGMASIWNYYDLAESIGLEEPGSRRFSVGRGL